MGSDSLETATFSCSSSISELSAKLSIEFGLESSSDTRSISILCGIATVRSPEKQVEKGQKLQNQFGKIKQNMYHSVSTDTITDTKTAFQRENSSYAPSIVWSIFSCHKNRYRLTLAKIACLESVWNN